MKPDVIELFKQASELPQQERAALAGLILETLEGEVDPDAEQKWSEEIRRRLAEIDAGTVQLIPWTTIRDQLDQKLRARS